MNKLPCCFTTRAGCAGVNECVSVSGTGDRMRQMVRNNKGKSDTNSHLCTQS